MLWRVALICLGFSECFFLAETNGPRGLGVPSHANEVWSRNAAGKRRVGLESNAFDMGFLQLVRKELRTSSSDENVSAEMKNSPLPSPASLHEQRMFAVLQYRRNRFLNGVQTTLQLFRELGRKIHETRHYLLAGALGRCVAVSVMFPIDTVKTRLQMFGSSCCSSGQWSEALQMPLYKGVGSSLLGQVRSLAICMF